MVWIRRCPPLPNSLSLNFLRSLSLFHSPPHTCTGRQTDRRTNTHTHTPRPPLVDDPCEAIRLQTLNPQRNPQIWHPQPSTLNPQPSTLNPRLPTLDPRPSTPNPRPSTLNRQPSTVNPQPALTSEAADVTLIPPHRPSAILGWVWCYCTASSRLTYSTF